MSGSLSGLVDWSLQAFALSTPAAKVAGVRILGLAVLAASLQVPARSRGIAAVVGVALVSVSFALIGHTTMPADRWLLAPVIVLHTLIVAFWFGSLRALIHVVSGDSVQAAAKVVERFSRLAGIAVPLIFLAGLLMTYCLLPAWQALASPYGLAVLGKMLAFAVLTGLAALNRWRLGPALTTGGATAVRSFCVVAKVEWLIIAAVLFGTAVLTMFLSPSH
jgi:putative copper export protein